MPKTTQKNTNMSAATRLAQHDIDNECSLLVSRWDRTDDDKTPLLGEEDLNELCFDIIADIDANDEDYDPD
eukprot:6254856-Ditylum_brightwellii.AAC.1